MWTLRVTLGFEGEGGLGVVWGRVIVLISAESFLRWWRFEPCHVTACHQAVKTVIGKLARCVVKTAASSRKWVGVGLGLGLGPLSHTCIFAWSRLSYMSETGWQEKSV
jgi:hypothetical protein